MQWRTRSERPRALLRPAPLPRRLRPAWPACCSQRLVSREQRLPVRAPAPGGSVKDGAKGEAPARPGGRSARAGAVPVAAVNGPSRAWRRGCAGARGRWSRGGSQRRERRLRQRHRWKRTERVRREGVAPGKRQPTAAWESAADALQGERRRESRARRGASSTCGEAGPEAPGDNSRRARKPLVWLVTSRPALQRSLGGRKAAAASVRTASFPRPQLLRRGGRPLQVQDTSQLAQVCAPSAPRRR